MRRYREMTNANAAMFRLMRVLGLSCFMVIFSAAAFAQEAACCRLGKVVDAAGVPVAGAHVLDSTGKQLTTTSTDGTFSVSDDVTRVEIVAEHVAPMFADTFRGIQTRIVVQRPLETVVVSAYRSPLSSEDSPASTRVMTTQDLQRAAPPALDDKLRTIPGFELFRRSSSLVANPTTQGVSLRGLGSTAASRSLVNFDGIPLNDPYGGWIHWEEIPSLAIQSVEVVRGGASDLYGSSAIGGVISILPVQPSSNSFQLSSFYGSEATSVTSILGTLAKSAWSGMIAGDNIVTDGYILVAPEFRGSIDQPSNVHAQNGLAEVDWRFRGDDRAFLRGSILNESRHNGTPMQVNSTRLWRYAGGADMGRFLLRLYGTAEGYDQSFSSINPARTAEKLTRFARDPADELGGQTIWRQPVGTHVFMLAGADTHDVRAADYEKLYTGAGGELRTTAHQRQTGVYGEALYTPANWTISGSARVDYFSNFDAKQYTQPRGFIRLPSLYETVVDPRLGLTRKLGQSFMLNASGFRAYRAPTENELYRAGQVGQQITLPNPYLKSERATGWESGLQFNAERIGSTVRASYFWNQVNRPITALTLSMTPTEEILQRANLGQIESRGVSIDYAMQERWIAVTGGYQFARATVTKFNPEPELVGKWIPQVAQNMATAQVQMSQKRFGFLSLQGRVSGRQFDDDMNLYLLHGYLQFDVYASRELGRHLRLYASGENIFDRTIEVGKTPVLTLGTPRVAQFGVRVNFGD
jgi:outer membrane receptor protein involved in Fe transport